MRAKLMRTERAPSKQADVSLVHLSGLRVAAQVTPGWQPSALSGGGARRHRTSGPASWPPTIRSRHPLPREDTGDRGLVG